MGNIHSIAILGVDGTGKSSVISNLKNMIGSGCTVQYMGYRDFENESLNLLIEKKNKNSSEKLIFLLGVYKELKTRVKRNAHFPGLVIYDRYVYEIYINALGRSGMFYRLLYKYFFPKPDAIVYLYCSAETSFSRKDDIPDQKQFREMKKRFDNIFLNNRHVVALDTEIYNSRELASIIINEFLDGKNHVK